MIAGGDFFANTEVGGINAGLWCQSNSTGDNVMAGSWKFPNGSRVGTVASPEIVIYMVHAAGQVGLLRRQGIGELKGMYICSITDANSESHMLVVWAAGNIDYAGL